MIQLRFAAIFADGSLVLLLLFRTPPRKLAIMGLDRVNRGHGRMVVKTVAATVCVVLASGVHSMVKIRRRGAVEDGRANRTDQVLMAKDLLESTLVAE